MNVIKYKEHRYTANMFIVITFDRTVRQILSGLGIMDIDDNENQWEHYYDIAKAAKLTYLDLSQYSEQYEFFTVDMYDYSTLYAMHDNALQEVFIGWDDLISTITSFSMNNHMHDGYATYEVFSIGTGQVFDISFKNDYIAYQQFERNYLASTRLLNIAVPKGYVSGFYAKSSNGNTSLTNIRYNKTTYNLTDFMHVQSLTGPCFEVSLASRFKLMVRINEISKRPGEAKTIIVNADSIDNLENLHGYANYEIEDNKLYIEFVYNPNRQYELSSTGKIIELPELSEKHVKIVSQDMLNHARALGIVVRNSYIETDENNPLQVTLNAILKTVYAEKLDIRSWIENDLEYVAETIDYNAVDSNRGQWLAYSYMFNKLQIDQKIVDITNFSANYVRYEFNNLHYFMINANAKVVKYCGEFNEGYVTNSNIRTNVANALDGIDLPVIKNQECFFLNHRYTFFTDIVNGKRFAVVLVHNANLNLHESKVETVTTKDYYVLLLNINFNNYFQRTTILVEGDVALQMAYDNTAEFNDVHSSEDGIENTFDLLRHVDIYEANVTELLPRHISSLIAQLIQPIRMDYTPAIDEIKESSIPIELPYTK